MRAEIKEQFQNFMDVRVTTQQTIESDAANRARGHSAKTESIYKEVPEIAEERKIGEDE